MGDFDSRTVIDMCGARQGPAGPLDDWIDGKHEEANQRGIVQDWMRPLYAGSLGRDWRGAMCYTRDWRLGIWSEAGRTQICVMILKFGSNILKVKLIGKH